MSRRPRAFQVAKEVLLTVGAIVGVLCLVLALASVVGGTRMLAVRSGSMSPALQTGDLAVSRTVAAPELRIGDVVSVLSAGGTRVTHRIVDIVEHGDQRQLHLKGDANATADPEVYTVAEAQRVVFHVARLGHVVDWLAGPLGRFLLGVYAAFLLWLLFRPAGRERVQSRHVRGRQGRRRAPRSRLRPRAGAVVAMVIVLGAAGVVRSTPGWAAWGDTVTMAGTTLTAATVPAPARFTCGTLDALALTFEWSAVPDATSYTVHYQSGAKQLTTAGLTLTLPLLSENHTAWVVAHRNFGSTTWTSAPSVSRSYRLLVVGTCS